MRIRVALFIGLTLSPALALAADDGYPDAPFTLLSEEDPSTFFSIPDSARLIRALEDIRFLRRTMRCAHHLRRAERSMNRALRLLRKEDAKLRIKDPEEDSD